MTKVEFWDGYETAKADLMRDERDWWDAGADMQHPRAAEFRAFVIGAAHAHKTTLAEVGEVKRWKRCDQCGKHLAAYIASGDDGDTDLCACCYGEPYDAAECVKGTGIASDTRWQNTAAGHE